MKEREQKYAMTDAEVMDRAVRIGRMHQEMVAFGVVVSADLMEEAVEGPMYE